MIKNLTYNLNKDILLTNEVLNSYILQFWNEVFPSFNQNEPVKHLMVLCKVKYSALDGIEGHYKTLGPLRRVEHRDLDLFTEYLNARLGIIVDSYDSNIIT